MPRNHPKIPQSAPALALAKAGAHVVATARAIGGLEELDSAIRAVGGTATLVPLEMRDSTGIARLAAAIDERYQHLDILIGNAALGGSNSPLDHVQPSEWDEVMAVYVTANWQLIHPTFAIFGGCCGSTAHDTSRTHRMLVKRLATCLEFIAVSTEDILQTPNVRAERAPTAGRWRPLERGVRRPRVQPDALRLAPCPTPGLLLVLK